MLCPIDQTTLVMSERKGIEIDYCPTCRGVWLDRGELDKVIDRSVETEIAAENRPAPSAPGAPAPMAPPVPNPVQAGPYGSPQPAYDPRYDDRRRDDDRRYDRDQDRDRRYDGDRRYDPRYKKKRKESFLENLFDF
ncbi:zf-TFIIB domain-containing protein [Promicromonospora iranensis]|uniref:Zn-finger nucleic acid-binding protein n=1 Tax=Promicromonospora iranensis TaxID=1105144 RepID=A0ABU2CLN0_9MICO|nr:zf-TFIIB domain-containing protein [Promicromonospora iranensis]MDR7382244.1 Zn-finger nucleic acid-binding protein [Promicromonospora iranensis]